ncbi:hypothetical protein [Streptomyces vilmorinianum]|uniref:hypothetical protein n=1 Tax=Streptomyces vilmorinianum TaxID=3051092 RepID=UPI001586DF1C|nr:hypothetical protein [Streptomyces vilmorinianum]
MAQDSWPSPNHSAGSVTQAEYERIAQRFSDDGVDGSPADTAVVAAGTGLQVTVRSGIYASVRGFAWSSGTVDTTLTIAGNTSGSTRLDRVVLRLDRSTWDVRAAIVAGTPGAGAPALTQNTGSTGLYEIPLAQVTVINSATSVTVAREEQYIGSRIRPCTSTTRPLAPRRGEQIFETDTFTWHGWNGNGWKLHHQDSGELTLGAGYIEWAPFGDSVGRRIGNVVSLRLGRSRTHSTLLRSNLEGSKLATIPTALRPDRDQYYTGQFSNGVNGRVEVRASGEIWIRNLSADVPSGQIILITTTYLKN